MIKPQVTEVMSRSDVDLIRQIEIKGELIEVVPIIAANMVNIGTPNVAKQLWYDHGCLTALQKGTPVDNETKDFCFQTIGLYDNPRKLYCDLDFISIDVANGYMSGFVDFVEIVRYANPDSYIMAGNVATVEGAHKLFEVGVNCVKVGIGPGAACTTRVKTGVGYPQLEAVMECAELAEEYNADICSDGGHKTPGDVAKSFAAGADFVMLGTMLAGTNETGDFIYGNASKDAQGKLAHYRAEEGRRLQVEHKGSLYDVMQDILGGLRSACSYSNAYDLQEFKEKAQLIKID